jgi:hypothetical protein
MSSYHCCFTDWNGQATPPEVIEANEPTEAVERGLKMLHARPHYRDVEIWDGGKRLYPLASAQQNQSQPT